ncbi:rhodanese-like domain-containing protein [Acidihalobacter ferrooxydans]|uniref:Sulfurtransferase n=1 Tax=Acidihalobacter ferrooxydans TaxID=1765967 RepID=A0A1P8UD88_9GAMM|nr:rhodanese-like domain-containing protein [Acidihalobacter ferrooxydans]APZ41746.1 sulfurtransferase [Acidihalobacter ferrooxydans]
MQEYLQFASSHVLLFMALAAIVGAIVWTEFQRLASGIKHLSANEAVVLMNKDDTIVLDVREDAELREGTIGKAKHIPLGALDQRLRELDKHREKTIIAYCRSGARSSRACAKLRKAGFEKVVNLRGGIVAWREAKLPVRKR